LAFSGGAFEDAGIAEGLDLVDVVAAAAAGVDAPGVEVGAEGGVAQVWREPRICGPRYLLALVLYGFELGERMAGQVFTFGADLR
jgi:hypothetical protein